ncbi:WD and tetratricopeptide repeats protein 1 isoform X2 [Hydra vulgaris]|uniref:WD and tetratricopeptide repeats protein 1 isoform X2 n=1 Tax=Hydra vulgaris TaxID=6087 RepID=A0ABM4BKK7_HYDVU
MFLQRKKCCNVTVRCKQRESEPICLKMFERDIQVSRSFVKTIDLENELEEHTGCVNCLEWSSCGDYLLSGSDDTRIILWDVRKRKSSVKINTTHQGNIFSVKFLPYSSDNIVASSAADRVINLYNVNTKSEIHSFKCHSGRVKKLAVSNHSPFLLWSGSEDGTLREFDLREAYHDCSSSCSNILINLRQHVSYTNEIKCIQVHPTYPELIAVGCNDAYLRLFDRRMLKHGNVASLNDKCVDYFVPGHLLPTSSKCLKRRLFVTTHISFSPCGTEVLQNLGGDHIYSYSLLEKKNSIKFKYLHNNHFVTHDKVEDVNFTNKCANVLNSAKNSILNSKAMKLKMKGNEAFTKKNYYRAIVYYNKALAIFPYNSVLLANRGAALIQRKWNGDVYFSLRDSQAAVALDPFHHKAFLRQVKCLQELKMHGEALKCFELFKEKFPEESQSATAKQLEADIKQSMNVKNAENNSRLPESKHNNKDEHSRQEKSYDFSNRFVGTCNITTDIKEASYFGAYGQYIAAGSDCGCMFIWERSSANIVKVLHGDESIVNCVQPHPTTCLIATSGIDPVVRLWSPQFESKKKELNIQDLVCSNQKNLNSDPLDEMLRTMGYIPALSDDDDSDEPRVNCATS